MIFILVDFTDTLWHDKRSRYIRYEGCARVMNENRGYNIAHVNENGYLSMTKQVNDQLADFGKRLALLRKEAGYTQQELADEISVSRRVVSYYESESQHPPANLLIDLVQTLNISADELLGIKPTKQNKQPDSRLLRRMQQIESLNANTKRQLLQIIDTFIEVEQLKAKV